MSNDDEMVVEGAGDLSSDSSLEERNSLERRNFSDRTFACIFRADMRTQGSGDLLSTDEDEPEEPVEQFDGSLPATHSYLGEGLIRVGGRAVLEAGWRGKVVALAQKSPVFPGETVPMLLPDPIKHTELCNALKQDNIFGLLFPDKTGVFLSGYGVLCEVYEAADDVIDIITFKAKAIHRIKLVNMPKVKQSIFIYNRSRWVEVEVLGERASRGLLSNDDSSLRLSPDRRRLEVALTPWPQFLYDMFNYEAIRKEICTYFKTLDFEQLPEEPVSLSFWVAGNLPLGPRARLQLLRTDGALARLHQARRHIRKLVSASVSCVSCGHNLARTGDVRGVSRAGPRAHYTNPGGYAHTVLTLRAAGGVILQGQPQLDFSWFPGYSWTVTMCSGCHAHVGWRFDALKKNLFPQHFYGLTSSSIVTRDRPRTYDDDEDVSEDEETEFDEENLGLDGLGVALRNYANANRLEDNITVDLDDFLSD